MWTDQYEIDENVHMTSLKLIVEHKIVVLQQTKFCHFTYLEYIFRQTFETFCDLNVDYIDLQYYFRAELTTWLRLTLYTHTATIF